MGVNQLVDFPPRRKVHTIAQSPELPAQRRIDAHGKPLI
jgi:hypothetical protein